MIRAFIILCALAFASPAVAQQSWSDSSGREGRGHGPRAEDVRPDRQGGGRRDDGWRGGGYYQGGGLRIEGGIRLGGSVGVVVKRRPPRQAWSPCYTVQVTDQWGRPVFDYRGRPLLQQRCW